MLSNIFAKGPYPEIPDTMCPVGIMAIAVGTSAHIVGTSTFSSLAQYSGTEAVKDVRNLNTLAEQFGPA